MANHENKEKSTANEWLTIIRKIKNAPTIVDFYLIRYRSAFHSTAGIHPILIRFPSKTTEEKHTQNVSDWK